MVSSVAVGAYEFFAGSESGAAAGVGALGAKAGGKTADSCANLSQDGRPEACDKSQRGDANPPDGCGAILRLELVPLGAAPKAVSSGAPSATATPASTSGAATTGAAAASTPLNPKASKLAADDEGFVEQHQGLD